MIDVREPSFLHEQYVEQKKSIICIADEFNSTYKKVRYWLLKWNIPIRTFSEAAQEIHQSENHGMWKGDEAGYAAIHYYIQARKHNPKLCEICGKEKKLELSCKDHNYTRNIEDYQYVCRSCHRKYDKEMNNK